MLIVELPRWKREVEMYWRSWNGQKASVMLRKVKIPKWLWWERNIGWDGKGKEIGTSYSQRPSLLPHSSWSLELLREEKEALLVLCPIYILSMLSLSLLLCERSY
jgi:hypothetical protein